MGYPGVVITHSELPDNQWSLLTPEGVFCTGRILSRTEYAAKWQNLPRGGIYYETKNHSNKTNGCVEYYFSMLPCEDVIDLTLKITNLDELIWRQVMADICLMNVRAQNFYDPDYSRTFIATRKGISPVSDFMESPKRPVFFKASKDSASMHFYIGNPFWNITDINITENIVMTQSIDGRWTIGFGWQDICMISCNSDEYHGCHHSNPYLGDIVPNQTAQINGKIYIAQQTPENLLRRFMSEMNTHK
ncbi:MAG: hypothetical protein A2007_06495 [Verrucomicrobia bacterium GWC2_42_7]|nr:MAG: hypothetical protein A2007_06495 [Verrucomicrobia bacterium GWC2_42_7]